MWNANSKKLKPISLLVIQCVILLTENGVKAVSIPRIQKIIKMSILNSKNLILRDNYLKMTLRKIEKNSWNLFLFCVE